MTPDSIAVVFFCYGLLVAMVFMSCYEYMRKGGIRDLRRQVALLSEAREASESGHVDGASPSKPKCVKHKFAYFRTPRKCVWCGVDE